MTNRKFNVSTDASSIKIEGNLYLEAVRLVLSSIHQLSFVRSYQDINIDFSLCQQIDPGAALAIISRVSSCRLEGVDFEVVLLANIDIKRLFGGRRFDPFDYVEKVYEADDNVTMIFRVQEEIQSYGSRYAGRSIRTKIENLMDMDTSKVINISLSGIEIISSSFADEAFAKIIQSKGFDLFKDRLRLSGSSHNVDAIIGRSVRQRMQESPHWK